LKHSCRDLWRSRFLKPAAFEAAERNGLAPLAVLFETPPSLDGGQAVAFDRETELA
jgi:hypothetical protein